MWPRMASDSLDSQGRPQPLIPLPPPPKCREYGHDPPCLTAKNFQSSFTAFPLSVPSLSYLPAPVCHQGSESLFISLSSETWGRVASSQWFCLSVYKS